MRMGGAAVVALRLEIREGQVFVYDSRGGMGIERFRPVVYYSDHGEPRVWRPFLERTEYGARALCAENGLELQMEVESCAPFVVLRLELANCGTHPLGIDQVCPLWLTEYGVIRVGVSAQQWSVYRNGYQSWTGTRSFRAAEVDRDPISPLLRVGLVDIARPSLATPGWFRSDLFTAIANLASGEVLVAGFLDGRNVFADVEVAIAGDNCTRWKATAYFEGKTLRPAQRLRVPPFALAAGDDAYKLLALYAELSGREMGARVPEKSPVGWCSWYEYFTDIDPRTIRDNVDAAKRLQFFLAFDYIQIDDGYQSAIGDWLQPNQKFRDGLATLVRDIREAGFKAGIWLAPFLAQRRSRLVAEHPEWFVRNEEGKPRFALWNPTWGLDPCYALDTTHPQALAWLRRVIHTLVHQWGVSLLKLDFLYAAALPGRRYDPEATRAEALRRGLETIREAAGGDAFLIACGCPLGPAVGVVDAMRIGPDVAPYWSNFLSRVPLRDLHGVATKHAVRNTLTRAFLHRRWWLNDPDCLMVRKHRTRLSEEEFRCLASVIVLSDGLFVLSDRLSALDSEEIDRLQQVVELRNEARFEPYVPDLMQRDPPQILVARSPEQCAVAVFQLEDRSASAVRIPLHNWLPQAQRLAHLFEYWSGQVIDVHAGVAELPVLPCHSARVLTLPPEA